MRDDALRYLVVSVAEPMSMMLSAMRKMARRDILSTTAMKMSTVSMFHRPTANSCTSSGYVSPSLCLYVGDAGGGEDLRRVVHDAVDASELVHHCQHHRQTQPAKVLPGEERVLDQLAVQQLSTLVRERRDHSLPERDSDDATFFAPAMLKEETQAYASDGVRRGR